MKRNTWITRMSALVCLAGSAMAQVDWSTTEPGGSSTGGMFTLQAVVGQPDAGAFSGGAYTLEGGYLVGATPTVCPGDTNGDSVVDIEDLANVLAVFGEPGPGSVGDTDGDGDTDLDDLSQVLANFGEACG